MTEVRYVTEIKPIIVCAPVRPQAPNKEKKKVLFVEKEVNDLFAKSDLKSFDKKDDIFLYYWACNPEQQTHYLTRHKDSNFTGSILITNYDILQELPKMDAIHLYDLYDMNLDEDFLKSAKKMV